MNTAIIDEPAIIFHPTIAKLIGLNEAIVLEKIHYWLQLYIKNQHKHTWNIKDGHMWIYNTYLDWQVQFPFWSYDTIKRAIRSLEKREWLISGNYNTWKVDRTKWYRIDYKKLNDDLTNMYAKQDSNVSTKVQNNTMDDEISSIPEGNLHQAITIETYKA